MRVPGWAVIASALALAAMDRRVLSAAAVDGRVRSFVKEKREQVNKVAAEQKIKVPAEAGKMFDAAARGQWRTATNLFEGIKKKHKPPDDFGNTNAWPGELWFPIQEVGALGDLAEEPGLWFFAEEVFRAVPRGSVYFGGTDPGRFMITALSTSHADGNPFFTITQNQLVARDYLKYVQSMYGSRLSVPALELIQRAFSNYLSDVQGRLKHDTEFPGEPKQLKPGEQVSVVDGRVQVSGNVAVMAINGAIAKAIFDQNSGREFYVEESFELEWMMPHFTPAGPIMKLNRRPPETLPDDMILRDREYWKGIAQRFIGWAADDGASLEEVCRVAEELHGKAPRKNFKGDREYLRSPMSANTWGRLRSTGGAVYALHEKNAGSASERRRMGREAQLAFKQAYTLSPKNPETVWRYTMYLLNTPEPQQARTLVQSALKLDPENKRTEETAKYVEGYIRWSQGNR